MHSTPELSCWIVLQEATDATSNAARDFSSSLLATGLDFLFLLRAKRFPPQVPNKDHFPDELHSTA